MHKLLSTLALFFTLGFTASAQTLSGHITDLQTGETLIGATVYNSSTLKGVAANKYGFYSLPLAKGANTILVNYVGYTSAELRINAVNDTLVNIPLESNNQLGEVQVSSKRIQQVLASPEMGMNKLQAKQIEKMPVLLGESDVLKTVQMLPGVNAGSEGMSGISVRGGSPDQTLILLDDVPVYNVNHLFGYFSVFNSQAIHDVILVKGAIPARYGGRLTSVLDISMKEGNNQKHKQYVSVGTLATKGTLEGPIVKGKGSYMFSGRRTWPDLPLRAFYFYDKTGMQITYGFWDINGKINYRFGEKDRVYLSMYSGRDAFRDYMDYSSESSVYDDTFSWGNTAASVRWNHIFNPKLFMNLTVYYSKYGYQKKTEVTPRDKDKQEDYWLEQYNSSLYDACLKADFDYSPNEKHQIKFGANISQKSFLPESVIKTNVASETQQKQGAHSNALIAELYAEDVFEITPEIKANLGLRTSFLYNSQKLKPYLMPRASIAYKPYDKISFKAGYSRMVQHVHQLTNSSLAFPTDLWVTSTPKAPSSRSNLLSVGSYYMPSPTYSFSVEAYYSQLKDVISYYPGTDFTQLDDREWSDVIMQGNGRTYGIEFSAEKKEGQLTGFANYTWSRSKRSFAEMFDWKYFPYEYDRPHKLSALANYDFIPKTGAKYKKALSATFTFTSGRLISMATANYPVVFPAGIDPKTNWYMGEVFYTPRPNNYRMSSFHHLDISWHLESLRKEKGSWTFGIYNVYNHFNTSHYNFRDDKIYEVAIFPVMPFVSWNKTF